jgi:hypothetical protein
MSHDEATALMSALAAPFAAEALHFKPAVVSGNRALALPYVDARAIQDRLDEVLGVAGWQDEYEPLPDGSVVCQLRCRIGGEWIVKTDVGSPSEQPDGGDRLKAAFSDALKRAAVKFGIGRYLYRLPSQWVDYDPAKKRFARTPLLPQEQAQPAKPARKSPSPAAAAPGANGAADGAITDEERQQLTTLLHRKGKTPGAALATAGCRGADLADLTNEQFRVLVDKLSRLADV